MPLTATLDIMRLFGTCVAQLEARGITIEESSDFRACEDRMHAIGKATITPMISSDYNDLSMDHAVWLILQKDGKDIGGVAARFDSLRRERLSDFWARTYERLYKNAGRLTGARQCDEITGDIVYMGEFFIAKTARGSRHLLSLYTHLLFAYCALRWQPDWLYAFIRADDVRRGYASEYGFTRQYPGAFTWSQRPQGRAEGEYVVALPSDDLQQMAQFFKERPCCLLGLDSLKSVA